MEMTSIVVTGANRGLGLGLVKQWLADSKVKHVIATTRDPDSATELRAIEDSRLSILKIDIEDDESIDYAVEEVSRLVGSPGLHLLLNNAGISAKMGDYPSKWRSNINRCLNVNATGTAVVAQKFLPLLRKASECSGRVAVCGAAIVNISSMRASINMEEGGYGSIAYKMSKTALNQLGRCLAEDLKADNIVVVQFCPGWVRTDMGGADGELTVEESATSLVSSIRSLSMEHSGLFYDRDLKRMQF